MSYETERRHERYHTELPLGLRWNNRVYPARLQNVSATGALLRTDAMPLLRMSVELSVLVPGTDEPVTVIARVVHVLFPPDSGPVAVGVEVLRGQECADIAWRRVVDHAAEVVGVSLGV